MKPIARAFAAVLLVAAVAPSIDRTGVGPERAFASQVADQTDQEDEQLLRATIRPRVGYAPAVVIIEALVEPANEKRFLDFVVDSGEYFRSSTIALSGAGAPRVSVVEFRAVPAGTYDVQVSMRGETGKVRARLHDRLIVR